MTYKKIAYRIISYRMISICANNHNIFIALLRCEIEKTFCHRYYVKKICENELSKLKPIEHSNNKNNVTDVSVTSLFS